MHNLSCENEFVFAWEWNIISISKAQNLTSFWYKWPGGTRKWANWRSGKEKRKSLSCISSTKRDIRHFHVVVVQWRQRNVQKGVMHPQNCCFANLILLPCHAVTAMKCTKERDAPAELLFCQSNPIAFLPFLLTSPSSTQCGDWSFHDNLTHQ